MPVKATGGGYRYGPKGSGGKLYRGPGAKARAAKQGRAIAISKARAAGHRIPQPPKKRKGRAKAKRRK